MAFIQIETRDEGKFVLINLDHVVRIVPVHGGTQFTFQDGHPGDPPTFILSKIDYGSVVAFLNSRRISLGTLDHG
jgi:hypothetical protein